MTTPEQPDGGRMWHRWVLDLALVLPAVLIFAGWLIVAIAHIHDRYEVGHGQGAWMALARHANVSGLYPRLFDGTSYGGTRHMPVPILLHAAFARLTGEYITSGKLVGLLATVGLMIAVFGFLRRLGCRWSWALALTASALGGFAGLRAGTTIGGEPLPVLFGVGAMAVVIQSRGHLALIAAAMLVALGVSAKFTALWAPLAIVGWLLLVDPRLAAVFAAYAVVACAALLGAFNVIADGRLVENLVATSGAGVQGAAGLLKAPARLIGYLVDGEPALWAFLPVLWVRHGNETLAPRDCIVAAGLACGRGTPPGRLCRYRDRSKPVDRPRGADGAMRRCPGRVCAPRRGRRESAGHGSGRDPDLERYHSLQRPCPSAAAGSDHRRGRRAQTVLAKHPDGSSAPW